MNQYRFGPFLLDAERRQLFREGAEVHLSPKAFQFLLHVLQQHPRALSKQELHDLLWPETYVSESSLATLVNEVRHALVDDARSPRYLRTVHGFGYAFADGPEQPRERVAVTLVWRGGEVALFPGKSIIGRDPQADVYLDDRSVSRQHAAIVVEPGRVTLEDLGSKNGTFVGSERIRGAVPLADHSTFHIGSVRVMLVLPGDTSTLTVASAHSLLE